MDEEAVTQHRFHAQNVICRISHNAHTSLRCLLPYFPALSCFFTNTVKFIFTILIPFMLGVDLRNLRFLKTLHVFTTYYIYSRVSTDNDCSQVLSKSLKQPEEAFSQARLESLPPLLSLEIKDQSGAVHCNFLSGPATNWT